MFEHQKHLLIYTSFGNKEIIMVYVMFVKRSRGHMQK